MVTKKMKKKVKQFIGPFYGRGLTVLKLHTWPLQGDNLFFTTMPPIVPSAHLINIQRMKGLSQPWSYVKLR